MHGNPSVLDEVLEDGPMVDPQTGLPNLGLWFDEQREAVRGDMARDLNSAFDDLAEAEDRVWDPLGRSDDDDDQGGSDEASPA